MDTHPQGGETYIHSQDCPIPKLSLSLPPMCAWRHAAASPQYPRNLPGTLRAKPGGLDGWDCRCSVSLSSRRWQVQDQSIGRLVPMNLLGPLQLLAASSSLQEPPATSLCCTLSSVHESVPASLLFVRTQPYWIRSWPISPSSHLNIPVTSPIAKYSLTLTCIWDVYISDVCVGGTYPIVALQLPA